MLPAKHLATGFSLVPAFATKENLLRVFYFKITALLFCGQCESVLGFLNFGMGYGKKSVP